MRLLGAIVLLIAVAASARADTPPTQGQLDAAKQAFEVAQKLYAERRYHEAIDKLQEAYRLSRNVFLMFNIAHAYDQIGDKPKALAFYVMFLDLAPVGSAKRDESQKRVAELKTANVEVDLEAVQLVLDESAGAPGDSPTLPVSTTPRIPKLQHAAVDSVPPGMPVHIVVQVPRDAGWTVTLSYRNADEPTYVTEPMTWRADGLYAQIPRTKAFGKSLHYYIEATDSAGTVVARNGKRSSPNLVMVEEPLASAPKLENPLVIEAPPRRPRKLLTPVSVSTAAAVLLIGTTITTYAIANSDENDGGTGQPYRGISQVSLVASVAAVGVAGYFWYRRATRPATGWAIAPVLDGDATGIAAARRF